MPPLIRLLYTLTLVIITAISAHAENSSQVLPNKKLYLDRCITLIKEKFPEQKLKSIKCTSFSYSYYSEIKWNQDTLNNEEYEKLPDASPVEKVTIKFIDLASINIEQEKDGKRTRIYKTYQVVFTITNQKEIIQFSLGTVSYYANGYMNSNYHEVK